MSNDGRLGKGKERRKLNAAQKKALPPQPRMMKVVDANTGRGRMFYVGADGALYSSLALAVASGA